MSRSRKNQSRGFTMLELLTAAAISSVVIAGITATMISQANQYQSHASRRSAQAGSRQSATFIENTLRNGGYGVDPDRMFLAYDGFDAANPTAAVNLKFPDAITIHTRDLMFQRTLTAATTTKLTFSVPLTEPIRRGQIFLALCAGGSEYAYVTAKAAAANALSIDLETSGAPAVESPVTIPASRFREQSKLATACYAAGTLVKIDRVSFYVALFDDDADTKTPSNPYLMMHRGLEMSGDTNIDAGDAVPVAAGVEQLQIAYIMNSAAASPSILGVTSATSPPRGDLWATSVTGPGWKDLYTAPTRFVSHPANIRQIRVTLVTRSLTTKPGYKGDDYFAPTATTSKESLGGGTVAWQQMENLDPSPATGFAPTGGKFLRTAFRFSVAPKNLLMRSQFMPPNDTGG